MERNQRLRAVLDFLYKTTDVRPYLVRSQGCIWIRLLTLLVVVKADFLDALIQVAEYFVMGLFIFL